MNDFYINERHEIYVLLGLSFLFLIPIILVGKKYEIIKRVSFINLLKVINKSFYYQIIICILGLIATFIMQKSFYISQNGIDLLFIELIFSFSLFLILYLPIIGILNIFGLLKRQRKT